MKLWIKDFNERQVHLAKPLHIKFLHFFTLKKRRIFYSIVLSTLYYYWPRLSNWFSNRKQRVINKYKRRWIGKYNPTAVQYILPEQFSYKPAKLSQESVDKLGPIILEGENKLKNGFSRQLIVNILTSVRKKEPIVILTF